MGALRSLLVVSLSLNFSHRLLFSFFFLSCCSLLRMRRQTLSSAAAVRWRLRPQQNPAAPLAMMSFPSPLGRSLADRSVATASITSVMRRKGGITTPCRRQVPLPRVASNSGRTTWHRSAPVRYSSRSAARARVTVAADVLRMKGLRGSLYCVPTDTTIAQGISYLVERRIGSLVVVNDNEVVGMVVRQSTWL